MSVFNITAKRAFEFANPNLHAIPLIHPRRTLGVHDFLYCTRGKWEIYLDGVPYVLFPDDVLVINAGVYHYGVKPCEVGTKDYFIHCYPVEGDVFSADYLGNDREDCVEISPIIHAGNCPEIKRLFKDIISTYWSQDVTKDAKCSTMMQYLILRLSENSDYAKTDSLPKKCVSLMAHSTDRFISPEEMAERLLVSERTLRNAFISAYGTTPYRFQKEMKLKQAVNLMKEYPDMSVRQLATSLGFFDESHFSKSFSQYYKKSPGAYKAAISSVDTVEGVEFQNITELDVPENERVLIDD